MPLTMNAMVDPVRPMLKCGDVKKCGDVVKCGDVILTFHWYHFNKSTFRKHFLDRRRVVGNGSTA